MGTAEKAAYTRWENSWWASESDLVLREHSLEKTLAVCDLHPIHLLDTDQPQVVRSIWAM